MLFVCVLPALTVTALTNCSLQLLLPTTKARFVFLISLSTVLCMHTKTHTHKHTNPTKKKQQAKKQKKTKAQEARAHTPRPPDRPGKTRPTSVLRYTERSKCFRLAKAHLKRKDFLTMAISAKLLLINTMKLAVRLPEKVRKKDRKRSSFFVISNKGCGRKESKNKR